MKRFLTFGVVMMTLLVLVLSGCSDPSPSPTGTAEITDISLSVFREGLEPSSEKPVSMEKGAVRIFTAVVTGTGDFNTAYTIAVTGDGVTAVDYEDIPGAKKVTATGDSGSFTVTATATGDSSKTASWTIDLVEETEAVITAIALKAGAPDQTPSATKPLDMENGAVLVFSAVVSGTGEFDLTYTITVEAEDDLVTVVDNENGTVTVTAIAGAGEFTVTATAAGDETITDVWTIELVAVGAGTPPPDFTNPQWKLLNTAIDRGVSLNASTTKTVPIANADKRYVIFNNEPGALIDQDASLAAPGAVTPYNHFKDVTIMYLDVPFVANITSYKPIVFEARVRISKWRDTANIWGSQSGQQWASVRQGVIMGMIEDPEGIDVKFDNDGLATNGANAPAFVGQRIAAGGQHRGYVRRATGEYGSQTMTPGTADVQTNLPGSTTSYHGALGANDYVDATMNHSTKVEGFADQEYIYRVMRTGATIYSFEVYNRIGDTLLFSYPLTGSNASSHPKVVGTDPVYLAFLVYGVEAEISDVKVYYNNEVAWVDSAVAGATPMTPSAKWVSVTAASPQKFPGDTENDYSCLVDNFPALGVTLSATVYPATLNPSTVTWTVTDGDCVEVDEGTVTKVSGKSGYATVTATPVAGGNAGTFKFYLMDAASAADPEGVTINTPVLSVLNYGNNTKDKVKLSAAVTPGSALQNVTWAITSGGDAATIDPDTGVLKAKKVSADTDVTVTAAATANSAIVSTAVTITVKKDEGLRQWTFGAGTLGTWADNDSTANATPVVLDGGLTINPLSAAIGRWAPNRVPGTAALSALYTGCFQPTGANTFGEINLVGEGLSSAGGDGVKVTIVWTHTGDSNPMSGDEIQIRNLWMKFDTEADIINDIKAHQNWNNGANEGWVVANAYFEVVGAGDKVTFGANSTMRLYAVIVEPSDYVPPDPPDPPEPTSYYEWNIGDGPNDGIFTLAGSPNETATVNGKSWTRLSGTLPVDTTGISMPSSGGGRFVIGSASTTATSSTVTDDAGEFDFSTKKTVTITYTDGAGAGNFQIYVNNNTTGQANSVLGGTSRIYSASVTTSGTITATIDPTTLSDHASLAKAFLCIRTESGITSMKITSIKIEDAE